MLPHSPLGAAALFAGRFYRRGGLRHERVLVSDDRPVLLEVEVRTVVAVVADQAALVFRRRLVISGGRRLDVFGAGAVTGFAVDVGELRRGFDADEPPIAVAERVTTYAISVKHPLLLFERGERVRMARIFPDFVFGLVALSARFRKSEQRVQQL